MSKIMVFSAGVSDPSSSSKLAEIYVQQLTELGHTVSFTRLREYGKEIMDALMLGFSPPKLDLILEQTYAADGAVFITPVFNASFNALLKGFVDVLDIERVKSMPVAVGATGGTPRHSLVLDYAVNPVFNHLHMPVADSSVFVATDDWGSWVGNIRERVGVNISHFLHLVETRKEPPKQSMEDYLNGLSFP